MGISAIGCVQKTGESALEAGFRVYSARDLIAYANEPSEERDFEWYLRNCESYALGHPGLLRRLEDGR
jgi:nicotinamidase-related amidase